MSKGMIVLDEIPERCECCLVETHYENQNGDEYGHQCPFTYAGFTLRFREEKRAYWCPIRPMPGRACHEDYCDHGRYDKGWNDCLKTILKGGGAE